MEVLHTAIAIVLAIGLIIVVKVDPVISLIISSLYLGLAAGVGFADTVTAITFGFGDIMAKVGLLIGFGVAIGALLHSLGAFRMLVRALLRVVGPRRLPYALTAALSTIFPSIYVDVQVVLAAPLARTSAPHVGRNGLALLSGAIGAGIFAGYVFVVPGLAAVSIASLLDVKLGEYLVYGIFLGPITAIATTLLFAVLLRTRYWNPRTDEEPEAIEDVDAVTNDDAAVQAADDLDSGLPLGVLLLPILVPLVLIAFGAVADVRGFSTPLIGFLGNATVALFIGLLGAYTLSRWKSGRDRTDEALSGGFRTTGEILLITGIGGSLGEVISATGMDQTLAGLFSADAGAPVVVTILLAWFIAAVLHLAIGSVSVAAIAAAGIIAPVVGSTGVAPVAIGLAIASGAMFALQVNSNFFWMFKSLLNLTTQGALKTMTMVTSIASLVSLPPVIVLALVL
ncbi:SLC13 family permease [Aeromicrobium sp.]|uniref:GntP family permease n=1 Tax=Aeromicrobium sp. TaxID=1871063 RepID=UPI0025C0BFD7|nr:SLC13 family permease [Aeromicrobium sp.]MCK5890251.1 GntP family permease [Aeromicrobium sp.]